MKTKAMAKHLSVMWTERIAPEMTTCEEVVRIGRYSCTNSFVRCPRRIMRSLQKRGVPFATGILMQCDVDNRVAADLAVKTFSTDAFEPPVSSTIEETRQLIEGVRYVIDAGMPIGRYNESTVELLKHAINLGVPVFSLREEIPSGLQGVRREESIETLMNLAIKL